MDDRRTSAVVQTGVLHGVQSLQVEIRVSRGEGAAGIEFSGIGDASAREARMRVLAALRSLGVELGRERLKIDVAPGDVCSSTAALELPIALVILARLGRLSSASFDGLFVVGSLSMTGDVLPVRGTLAHVRDARRRGLRAALIPSASQGRGRTARGIEVQVAETLKAAVDFVRGRDCTDAPSSAVESATTTFDLADIVGQERAKRALEIAAGGGHNVLLVGAPGTGKTMLARRLLGLLAEPCSELAQCIATIADVAGLEIEGARPFRAPHHTCGDAGLFGGGEAGRPGEVTLAHGGVLLLDELTEFRVGTLRQLASVLRYRRVAAHGKAGVARMPADSIVVAAMNPCPCGWLGHPSKACSCSRGQIEWYRERIPQELLDCFPLRVGLAARGASESGSSESSAVVRGRVIAAQDLVLAGSRRGGKPGALRVRLEEVANCARAAEACSGESEGRRVHGVARTIAALAGRNVVTVDDVAEAKSFQELWSDPRAQEHAKAC